MRGGATFHLSQPSASSTSTAYPTVREKAGKICLFREICPSRTPTQLKFLKIQSRDALVFMPFENCSFSLHETRATGVVGTSTVSCMEPYGYELVRTCNRSSQNNCGIGYINLKSWDFYTNILSTASTNGGECHQENVPIV